MRVGGEDALRAFLLQVAQLPRLNQAQMDTLAAEAEAGDRLALRSLAQAHLPLVVALAAERRGRGLRFDRLLACGNRALLNTLRLAPSQRGTLVGQISGAMEQALSLTPLKARSQSL